MVATEAGATLAQYRSHHIIDLATEGTGSATTYRCRVDGIRVLPTRDGRWRHHPDDITRLLEAEYGGPWGGPQAKERAIERIAGLVDVDPDEEPEFDREGQPEFNGAFR